MQLDPISSPTMVLLPPNPNIASPLLPRRHTCGLGLLAFAGFSHRALFFHPLVEFRLLEPPAVPEFEGRDFFLVDVLVERVGTNAQVLGGLPNVHYFTRIGHKALSPFHEGDSTGFACPCGQTTLTDPH